MDLGHRGVRQASLVCLIYRLSHVSTPLKGNVATCLISV